tara:strand:- start:3898 stop:4002 length:105 start_codon:yes stop_codon:yes gene_type:complete
MVITLGIGLDYPEFYVAEHSEVKSDKWIYLFIFQ